MNTKSKEKLNKTPAYKQAIIIFMVALLVLPLFTWQTTLSDPGTTSELWSGNQATGYQSGNGTAGNPYIIMTAEQLAYFSNQSATYANTYFKLGQNILVNNMNAERTAFSGTVRLFTPKTNFQGIFDGDGYEIIGLSIEATYTESGGFIGIGKKYTWESDLGLFKQLSGSAAEVKNLSVFGKVEGGSGKLSSWDIFASSEASNNVGGIAGRMSDNAKITNCSFTGSVEIQSDGQYAGGIVARMDGGSIENCSAGGSIGGAATVQGANDNVGGIAGGMEAGAISIKDSYFYGKITGRNNVGGITGLMMNANNLVQACSISGIQVVDATNMAGGIVGKQNDGTVNQCQVFGVIGGSLNTVTGKQDTGGIVGGLLKGAIKESVFKGRMTGTTEVGGIAGKQEGAAKIEDCEAEGNIQGSSNIVGGIVGNLVNGTIDSSVVRADISGSNNVGGVAGTLSSGTISKCLLDGNVSGSKYVGGTAGQTAKNTRIEYCFTTRDKLIYGSGGSETEVGGIVGEHAGTICTSVNYANVTGSHTIGGIAGKLVEYNAAIGHSINEGVVHATNSSGRGGGIIGNVATPTSSSNNKYLVHKNVNLGTVAGSGSNKGSIGGFARTSLPNAKYNFYQYYSGAPTAYTGSNADYGSGYDFAGAPVGSSNASYSHLSWHGLVIGDDGYDKYLNISTNSPCDSLPYEDAYYLDPNNDWLPMVDLDETGQPPVSMDACITSGMEYIMPESPWEDEVEITNDSVLTIAYRFGVNIGCPPSRLALSFKYSDTPDGVDLPAGTRITVMAKGEYYYKILTGTEDNLQLNTFYKMGSTTDKFQGTTWGDEEDRDFLVSLDFTNVPYDDRLPEGAYDVVFLPLYGTTLSEYPVMDIKKQDFYYGGAGVTNGFHLELMATPAAVDAYNHLVDGKEFGIEFYIEDENQNHWPLPLGSKVNGVPISRETPYQILPFSMFEEYNYTIELPPEYAGYRIATAIAYASEDPSLPRGGHILLKDSAGITFTAISTGDGYALRTDIEFMGRFLDYSDSNQSLPLQTTFTPTSNVTLKATLYKKYGEVYSKMDHPVQTPSQISSGLYSVTVPGGTPKGTYRLIITLNDSGGAERANSIENFIIK